MNDAKHNYGKILSLPPFKGKILPNFDDPFFINQIADCGEMQKLPGFRLIFKGRNRVAEAVFTRKDGGAMPVVIKEFRIKGIDRLKSIMFSSKASKAWIGAMALMVHGFNTPKPIVYLEKKGILSVKEGYFIAERITDITEIRSLFQEMPQKKLKPLLAELAKNLSQIHKKGILHRDLSDGNILVNRAEDGSYIFYFIDTNRIRKKSTWSLLKRIKSLIRLGIPEGLQMFFLEQYMQSKPVKKHIWLWYRLTKKTFSGYIRLKKFLKLKRLAQKLKIQ